MPHRPASKGQREAMAHVYVVGVAMTAFRKHVDSSVKALTADAVRAVLADASLSTGDLQAVWFSNSGWGMTSGQHCIRGQVALAPLGVAEVPITNVENACAGGSSAFHNAYLGVASGMYDVALAVGAEESFAKGESGQRDFSRFQAAADVDTAPELFERLRAEVEAIHAEMAGRGEIQAPGGRGSGSPRSPAMDLYSARARAHMRAYGTTQRQLAAIAAKNHNNGSMNPLAQYRMPMSVGEVLDDRLVSWPLTRAMCAPVGNGAAAAILVSADILDHLRNRRAVQVRASVLASARIQGQTQRGARDAPVLAYEMAGLGPEDIDVAEVHDATAFGELAQTERLGFCGEGEGGRYAQSGATALGGSLPVNPSGGLECRGHPIGATGLAQIFEIVTQLRHEAGGRQAEGVHMGLAQNSGGVIGTGEATYAVHIFEAPRSKAG